MTTDAKDLLELALRLPPRARAALAGELIDSLDDAESDERVDPAEVEAAWADEVRERLNTLDNGSVVPVAWPEARRRILAAAGIGGEAD